MNVLPGDDAFAPKGDIAPARAALLRFATDGRPTLRPVIVKTIDAVLQIFAEEYNKNRERWRTAPRPRALTSTDGDLFELEKAAIHFAAVLERFRDNATLADLIAGRTWIRLHGSAPMPQGLTPPSLSELGWLTREIAIAYSDGARFDTVADLIAPSVKSVRALATVANSLRRGAGKAPKDKGGARNTVLTRSKFPSPEELLAARCFSAITELFGETRASRATSTPFKPGAKARQPPPFEALLAEMIVFATGDPPPNLERPLRALSSARRKRIAQPPRSMFSPAFVRIVRDYFGISAEP